MSTKHVVAVTAILMVLGVSLAFPALANRNFSSLEEMMSARDFREAGLDKLTEEELANLNRWIRQRSLAEYPAAGIAEGSGRGEAGREAGDRRGMRDRDRGDRNPIRSRIDGSFSGWSGNTQFVLENGMVWRQSERGNFYIEAVDNPEVEIRPAMLGTWRLRVDGYSTSVQVERVR